MKKIIVLLFTFLLAMGLSSCTTVQENVKLSKNALNVQAIEIYHLTQSYYEGDVDQLLQNNTPISTLKKERHLDFLDAVCDLQFEKERGFFLIPADGGYDYTGYVIAIIYSDGSYDIIAESGLYSYVIGKNGKAQHKYDPSDYCGSTPWTDFIKQYIEE